MLIQFKMLTAEKEKKCFGSIYIQFTPKNFKTFRAFKTSALVKKIIMITCNLKLFKIKYI